MINRDLAEVDQQDLQRLIDTPVLEGDRIEYKAQLTLATDDAKKKFLAGVASLANSSGGDLIYGIEADAGRPLNLIGLENFNFDAESIRVRDLVRTGISPPVPTVETKVVPLATGTAVFVVRVRKTWAGAHMVIYNNDNRFYIRHGGARRLMDAAEIRSAFLGAEQIVERVQKFRLERISAILSDDTPCPINGRATLTLHIVPFRAFDPGFRPDIQPRALYTTLTTLSGTGGLRHEFDGVNALDSNYPNSPNGYAFLFRNGVLEILDASCLGANGESRRIPSLSFEQELLRHFPTWLSAFQSIGAEPPAVVLLTLLNVKGYRMAVNPGFGGTGTHAISRDHLQVPGTIIESFTAKSPPEIAALLRPHFDAVWNACGHPQSIYYDADGRRHGVLP